MLTLTSLVNQTVSLTDPQGRDIGTIVVESIRDDLLLGTFTPGPDYAAVRPLFLDFEEAADAQALGVVDEYEKEIEGIGLHIRPRGDAVVRVYDVQIWTDGGVSCRFRPYRPPTPAAQAVNGAHMARPPVSDNRSVDLN